MKASEELREKMWELCYDLLPTGERDALIDQIKSDPQAARLYAEVRLQADLVGFAAKVEDSSLNLSAEAEKAKNEPLAPAGGKKKDAALPPASKGPAASRALWVTWLPAVAALVLIGLIVGGVYAPRSGQDQLAQLTVVEIDAPSRMPAGVSNKITLRTQQRGGEPATWPVSIKVRDQSGQVRFQEVILTPKDGTATVDVPGAAMVAGARLEVEPIEQDAYFDAPDAAATPPTDPQSAAANSLTAALPVASGPPVMYYLMEKPVAQAGEQVRFAAIAFEPFSMEAAPPLVEKLMLKDAEGSPVVEPMWNVEQNVVQGLFELPQSAGEGLLGLQEGGRSDRARASSSLAAQADADKTKRQAGGGQQPAGRGQGEAAPQERSPSVANLDRWLYLESDRYEARENQQLEDSKQLERLAKRDAEVKLKEEDAVLAELSGQLSAERSSDISDRSKIVEAGEPVEVEIPAAVERKKLVADVLVRGVNLARQVIDAPAQSRATGDRAELESVKKSHSVTVHLPPEADGEMRVKLTDLSQSPPQVVSDERFYRRSSRELKVVPQNLADRYDPGETVRLNLQVVDENGGPAAASVAARVWREDYVPAGENLVMLADTVRQLDRQDFDASLAREAGRLLAFGKAGFAGTTGLTGTESLVETPSLAEKEIAGNVDEIKKVEANDAASIADAIPSAPAPAPALEPAARPARSMPEGAREADPAALAFGTGAPGGGVGGGGGLGIDAEALVRSGPAAADDFAAGGEVRLLLSNRRDVESRFLVQEHESRQAHQAWQAFVGRVLLFGALAVLALVGLLFLLRMPVRAGSGTLALVAAAASLVVGAFWTGSSRQPTSVAMVADDQLRPRAIAPAESPPASSLSNEQIGQTADVDQTYRSTSGGETEGKFKSSLGADMPSGAPTAATPPAPAGGFAAPPARGLAESAPAPDAADFARPRSFASDPLKAAEEDKATADKSDPNAQLSLAPAKPAAERAEAAKSREAAQKQTAGASITAETGKPAAGAKSAMRPDSGAGGFGGAGAAGPTVSGGAGMPAEPGPDGSRRARFAVPSSAPAQDAKETVHAKEIARPDGPQRGTTGSIAGARLGTSPAPAATSPAPADAADRSLRRGGQTEYFTRDGQAIAPSAIYFNPRLATDEQGLVTLEFLLPEVESEYRLLIDAFGNGRVGSSSELRIVCRKAD